MTVGVGIENCETPVFRHVTCIQLSFRLDNGCTINASKSLRGGGVSIIACNKQVRNRRHNALANRNRKGICILAEKQWGNLSQFLVIQRKSRIDVVVHGNSNISGVNGGRRITGNRRIALQCPDGGNLCNNLSAVGNLLAGKISGNGTNNRVLSGKQCKPALGDKGWSK